MPRTKPNVEFLDQTLAEVERAARRRVLAAWNQNAWRTPVVSDSGRCGTAMCFAGHADELAGGRWVLRPEHVTRHPGLFGSYYNPDQWELLLAERGERTRGHLNHAEDFFTERELAALGIRANTRVIRAAERAQRLLRLDSDQAGALFSSANSLPDLRRMVADIKAGREINELDDDYGDDSDG